MEEPELRSDRISFNPVQSSVVQSYIKSHDDSKCQMFLTTVNDKNNDDDSNNNDNIIII